VLQAFNLRRVASRRALAIRESSRCGNDSHVIHAAAFLGLFTAIHCSLGT